MTRLKVYYKRYVFKVRIQQLLLLVAIFMTFSQMKSSRRLIKVR